MANPPFERIEEDALRILETLCRRQSVSAEGRELEETASVVADFMAEVGFDVRQLRADGAPPAVYGEQRGRSGYTLLLYNHYDVQPADPIELWETPPFEPTVRDGKVFARGTADNKGELAVRLAVVHALREQARELPIGIRWIVEGEEEMTSPHFDEIVRQNADLLRADACLWEGAPARLSDGRPSVCLGFKGSLAVRLDLRLLNTDAHSGAAAAVPSAAWRLVEALATLRDPEGTVLIDRFYDAVVPATEAELAAIAAQSESIETDLRELLGVDRFLEGVTGTALRERAAFGPTCNIAGIKTGYSGPGMKTVLPAEASAWLDLRLVPKQRPAETLALLRQHLEREGFGDIQITVLGSAEAAGTSIEHPFVQHVMRVAETVAGRPPSITVRAGGSLPIIDVLQRHVGLPGVAAPDNPVYLGSRAHAPDEHIRVEDLGHAARFAYALLEGLAESA